MGMNEINQPKQETTMNWFVKTENWHILGTYKTQSAAKSAVTRKWGIRYPTATVIDSETFKKDQPMVERKNLMSGTTFMIEASQAGGCCDPSTERYWSM